MTIHGKSRERSVANNNMSIAEMESLGFLDDGEREPEITDTELLLEGINPLEVEEEEAVGWNCPTCDEPNPSDTCKCETCGYIRSCE